MSVSIDLPYCTDKDGTLYYLINIHVHILNNLFISKQFIFCKKIKMKYKNEVIKKLKKKKKKKIRKPTAGLC